MSIRTVVMCDSVHCPEMGNVDANHPDVLPEGWLSMRTPSIDEWWEGPILHQFCSPRCADRHAVDVMYAKKSDSTPLAPWERELLEGDVT